MRYNIIILIIIVFILYYDMSGIVISILHLLITHLIAFITLRAQHSYYSHYADKEVKVQRG